MHARCNKANRVQSLLRGVMGLPEHCGNQNIWMHSHTLADWYKNSSPLVTQSSASTMWLQSCRPVLVVLLLAVITLPELGATAVREPPVVETKSGKVRGYVKSLDETHEVFVYEGIPYGK